jgi:hypothetical protein
MLAGCSGDLSFRYEDRDGSSTYFERSERPLPRPAPLPNFEGLY